MGGPELRYIGLARNAAGIGLCNLAYNLKRYVERAHGKIEVFSIEADENVSLESVGTTVKIVFLNQGIGSKDRGASIELANSQA